MIDTINESIEEKQIKIFIQSEYKEIINDLKKGEVIQPNVELLVKIPIAQCNNLIKIVWWVAKISKTWTLVSSIFRYCSYISSQLSVTLEKIDFMCIEIKGSPGLMPYGISIP